MSDDTGGLAEDVLLVARHALYPSVYDAEDGLDARALVLFREWFDPVLAARVAAARADERERVLGEVRPAVLALAVAVGETTQDGEA